MESLQERTVISYENYLHVIFQETGIIMHSRFFGSLLSQAQTIESFQEQVCQCVCMYVYMYVHVSMPWFCVHVILCLKSDLLSLLVACLLQYKENILAVSIYTPLHIIGLSCKQCSSHKFAFLPSAKYLCHIISSKNTFVPLVFQQKYFYDE